MGHLGNPGISQNTHAFNQPLSQWNTSAAINMTRMFALARSFNQDISGWNTANVTTMAGMFRGVAGVHGFNRSLNAWDVSNVIDMSEMFSFSDYNQPLGAWNVSAVTTMRAMFLSGLFNQPIGAWVVSSATDMAFMFASASTNQQRAFFDQDISAWDVSNVTDMEAMFGAVGAGHSQRVEFNNGGSPAIGGWDVSNVTNMRAMFRSGDSNSVNPYHRFNQPIGSWNVASVTTMRDMFRGCRQNFDQDISQWPLRPGGIDLTDFMAIDVERAFSEANYSRLLTGWANRVDAVSGPFLVPFGTADRVYNTTVYQPASRFTNAADARVFLVAPRSVAVSAASTVDADGTYTFDAATGLYAKATGWYFLKLGSTWTLYDATDAPQASGDANLPWEATAWTGLLSTATLRNAGAAWTITGDIAA